MPTSTTCDAVASTNSCMFAYMVEPTTSATMAHTVWYSTEISSRQPAGDTAEYGTVTIRYGSPGLRRYGTERGSLRTPSVRIQPFMVILVILVIMIVVIVVIIAG